MIIYLVFRDREGDLFAPVFNQTAADTVVQSLKDVGYAEAHKIGVETLDNPGSTEPEFSKLTAGSMVETTTLKCDCLICQVSARHIENGVPQIIVQMCSSLVGQWAGIQNPPITADNFTEACANRLDVLLTDWHRTKTMAEKMLAVGAITDEEFREAINSPSPAKSANLYTKIQDFAKSQAH